MDNEMQREGGEYWLTISDLMSGLMIVFLFISVAFMRYKEAENDKIKAIAIAYEKNQIEIYQALNKEFQHDLKLWNASIDDKTLSFQFNSPEVLFETGKSSINSNFKQILSDFIPRFLSVLEKYKSNIQEVRIEGHTSSEWTQQTNENVAYFNNMQLSQERTLEVLKYSYFIQKISANQRQWMKSSFVAVGFSSSKIIKTKDDKEDKMRSRRVAFRVLTNADNEIQKILKGF